MIRHVVFFKWRQESSDGKRKEVIEELRALPDKIDVIREFEVGEDVLRTARAWDAAIVATFDDLEALEKYQRHDDHLAVVTKLQAVRDEIGSVDYEF
jgi:hypothetical protein